ncbi:Transposon Tf2-1 polyprotein [Fusarium oxysporum f. sp. albedinis]|nr:Transposon Tf2-1 polyprotein [Fusarium oxysporum f. sp. albedinis]
MYHLNTSRLIKLNKTTRDSGIAQRELAFRTCKYYRSQRRTGPKESMLEAIPQDGSIYYELKSHDFFSLGPIN